MMEDAEGRYRMPEERWKRVAHIFVRRRGRGRRIEHPKAKVEAIMDRYEGGYQWRKLPSEYELKWNSVWRAHRRWSERQAYLMLLLTLKKEIDYGVLIIDGTFVKAHRSAAGARRNGLTPGLSRQKQGIARTKGGLTTKVITLVDRRGRLVNRVVVPGTAFEPWYLPMLMEGVRMDLVRYLVADGLYRTVAVREFLAEHDIEFISKPETNKRNAEGPIDPRDPRVVIYKGRGIVENVYVDDKNFRAFSTRYDKLIVTFTGGFDLTSWHYEGRPHEVRKSKYLEDL